MNAQPRPADRTAPASLALDNLRAFVILLVLSFHAAIAYLDFLPKTPFAFDQPPYRWQAFPIIDAQRWLGLDIYCAWQDVFLMSLFFFLSGLFVWPSLKRKGALGFLHDRVLRLGLPFALVVLFLMPVALYPTYLQTAAIGSVAAYWRHWMALPVWPEGPMWFLWVLLAFDAVAAGLYKFAPQLGAAWTRLAAGAADRPALYVAGFLALAAFLYVPMALAFTPGAWVQEGPFSFQTSRLLHYALYFFAGLGVGAGGIERGLFAPSGTLARRWPWWLAGAVASFLAWMGLMGLTMRGNAPWLLQGLADASFSLACFASCFCVLALFLRFARRNSAISDSLRANAYGMYLVHYAFIVWLQYALLPFALPAILKAAAVFAGTLAASWTVTAAMRRLPPAANILGAGRPALPRAS